MAKSAKQNFPITGDGQTADWPFAEGSNGGTLLMSRHDASGVTAATTKLQFKVPGQSDWVDVAGIVTPAQLTGPGSLEVDLPRCTLRVDTSSFAGPGTITIDLITNRVF